MYVRCEDKNDEHYEELKLMEEELLHIASDENFKLIALPMTDAILFLKEKDYLLLMQTFFL